MGNTADALPRLRIASEDILPQGASLNNGLGNRYVVFDTEQERARNLIVYNLTRGLYDCVLELAQEFNIDLPREHLLTVAKIYSSRGDSKSLSYAARAYQHLGDGAASRDLEWCAIDARKKEVKEMIKKHKTYISRHPK